MLCSRDYDVYFVLEFVRPLCWCEVYVMHGGGVEGGWGVMDLRFVGGDLLLVLSETHLSASTRFLGCFRIFVASV